MNFDRYVTKLRKRQTPSLSVGGDTHLAAWVFAGSGFRPSAVIRCPTCGAADWWMWQFQFQPSEPPYWSVESCKKGWFFIQLYLEEPRLGIQDGEYWLKSILLWCASGNAPFWLLSLSPLGQYRFLSCPYTWQLPYNWPTLWAGPPLWYNHLSPSQPDYPVLFLWKLRVAGVLDAQHFLCLDLDHLFAWQSPGSACWLWKITQVNGYILFQSDNISSAHLFHFDTILQRV